METQKKIYLDQLGYERLQEEIRKAEENLRNIQRYKGEVAIYQGDNWHDNPTLYQTEMLERMAIHKLHNLKSKLDSVEFISPKSTTEALVQIGSTVTVCIYFDDQEETANFKLVTGSPIDSTEISIYSPLGEAVFGKAVDQTFTYSVNGNTITAKILNIQ